MQAKRDFVRQDTLRSRAHSARTIRAVRAVDSRKRGDETRALADASARRMPRVGPRAVRVEIAECIVNVAMRRADIATRLRKDELPLRINGRASARGWTDLAARHDDDGVPLARTNPALRNGLERALLMTRI